MKGWDPLAEAPLHWLYQTQALLLLRKLQHRTAAMLIFQEQAVKIVLLVSKKQFSPV